MKVAEILDDSTFVDIMPALTEAAGIFASSKTNRPGMLSKLASGGAKFMKRNPAVAVIAATTAIDSYSQFKRNNRNAIRLVGVTPHERRIIGGIVKQLTQSGKFRLKKAKFLPGGGKSWVLMRTGA